MGLGAGDEAADDLGVADAETLLADIFGASTTVAQTDVCVCRYEYSHPGGQVE